MRIDRPLTPAEAVRAALLVTYGILLVAGMVLVGHRVICGTIDFARMAAAAPFYSSHHISSFIGDLVVPYDSRAQKAAHSSVLVLLCFVVAYSPLRRWLTLKLKGRAAARCCYALSVAFGCLLVLNLVPRWWGGAAPFRRNIAEYIGATIALVAIYVMYRRRPSLTNKVAGIAVALALFVVVLPGIWRPMDLSTSGTQFITAMESHYSMILGTGELMAAGKPLFASTRPYYGVLMPLLTVALQRAGWLESVGAWFQYIRVAQALFLVAVTVSLYRYARGHWVYCLLPCALIFPWYHFAHMSILFPNQSGFRLLGPALVTLLITHFSRNTTDRAAALLLGLGVGIACLANIETGIPCAIGALLYLWVRSRHHDADLKTRIALLGNFVAAALVSLAVWLIAVRVAAGYWIVDVVSAGSSYLGVIRLFFQLNLGGMPLSHDIWPIILFGHAVFVLLELSIRGGRPSARDPVRAYAASIIVVWFSYYANRPHPWNLSGFYMFYAFLVVDTTRSVVVAARRRWFRLPFVMAATILFLGVIPQAVQIERASKLRPALWAQTPRVSLVSGVYLPTLYGQELLERVKFISSMASEKKTVYLTGDSFFVPVMSHVVSDIPFLDAANETFVEADFDKLLSRIECASVSHVYVDSPESATSRQGIFRRFYGYLSNKLKPTYLPQAESHGWSVLQRVE